ncbi:MAG: hypothetical protein H6557_16205 [Lewinellaceae bacterium]|nr:hypothetical protein [Lewinellaceae bacterium]
MEAAIFWNGAILLALILVLFVQWQEIKRLRLDLLSSFVVIAALNTIFLTGARLGAVDVGYYDFPGVHFYPEPIVSFGLVNWGFNDRSGATNLRLGIASLRKERALMITGVPLWGKPISIWMAVFTFNGE